MTQSCHTGTEVGPVPWFWTVNETGAEVPEKTPLGGGVTLVTARSGTGCGFTRIASVATVVSLLKCVPSPTVWVALVVTTNQYIPAVWGSGTSWIRCTEPPTVSVVVIEKLAS